MLQFLRNNGLKIEVPSMTAVDATLLYVKEKYKRVSVFCRSNIKALFSEFDTGEDPEAVVLGDIDDGWTYERLNEIFRKVFNGADIIAMHKNRYWEPDGKIPIMDAGAFISAIEYATSKTALVIGKPSSIYFNTALRRLGFEPGSKFLMVGDDLESDIAAAQQIGGMGILVYTGKTKYPLNDSMVRPDFEAKNLREVVKILSQL
jgi:HAD superfamily hydrolase (TIGR01458 family)